MDWYVKKTALYDPAAHADSTPPIIMPEEHQAPIPTGGTPPRLKLKTRGKGKGGPNLWRKNRQ